MSSEIEPGSRERRHYTDPTDSADMAGRVATGRTVHVGGIGFAPKKSKEAIERDRVRAEKSRKKKKK